MPGAAIHHHASPSPASLELSAGRLQLHEQQQQQQRYGGWRSMPYILLNELAERLASVGLALNLISYLMGEYHMTQVTAASIISIVHGTASLTPLVGAFLSDAYLGRFWTIIMGSVANLIACFLLVLSAACPSLRPSGGPHNAASQGQVAFLMMALAWTTVAAGGLRPCTYAFGADQFQQLQCNNNKNKDDVITASSTSTRTQSFFNWYFFFLYLASLLGATVLVYVQDNVGWVWGFAVPGASVVAAIVLLLVGSRRFLYAPRSGSPFTAFTRVVVAAFRKRKMDLPQDPCKLYHVPNTVKKQHLPTRTTAIDDPLPHTQRFKWLDHAAIPTAEDFKVEDGGVKNPYRLCSVGRVEELKAVLALAPIWAINLLSTTILSQHSAFNVPQAKTMDRHIVHGSSFQVPAASMMVFTYATLLAWMPLYDRVVVPRARRVTGQAGGIKVLQRIGAGFVISVVALLVAGAVEAKRRGYARSHGFANTPKRPIPMSVFWLAPQYCLFGLGDSFHAVGQLEFLYDQLPDNMRSMAGAVFWCSSGLGHYGGTLLLQLVHRLTGHAPHHRGSWLDDNLNRGHLDYFFYLLAFLESIVFLLFLTVARRYTYKSNYTSTSTAANTTSNTPNPPSTLALEASALPADRLNVHNMHAIDEP